MRAAVGAVAEHPEEVAEPVSVRNPALAKLMGLLTGKELRRGALSILDQGVVSGLSFATSSIIAIACGAYGLGVAHLAQVMMIFMMNVQGELVTAPFTVYRSRRDGPRLAVYAGSVLVHQTVLMLGGVAALAALLVVLLMGFGPTHLAPTLWVLLLAGPFCLLHSFLRHFSFACFQFRVALFMDVAVAALQLSVMVPLAYTQQLTVPTVFFIMGGSCAVACGGWILARPAPLQFRLSKAWTHWRENWTFGRWALSSHVVGCAMTYVLPCLLAATHGTSATGLLAACGKLSALAATFVMGVAHFLTPQAVYAYAHRGARGLLKVLFVTGTVFVFSVGSFCVVVALFGDPLMVLLFGSDFADTGMIAAVLSVSVLLNSLAVLAGNALWAVDRPQANLIGDLASLLTTLGAALMLIDPLGVLGAAIAVVVGGVTGAVVRGATFWIVLRKLHPEFGSAQK